MTIGKLRSLLYGAGKVLGDYNAVKRGKVGERIGRRIAGRATARLLSGLFR
jgi:hypothetical protein